MFDALLHAGMFTGTGNGTSNGGNTLGSAPGNATGATSHASAQLGLDGSLTEPSRQERRAQALHKYKQKRKVGAFFLLSSSISGL